MESEMTLNKATIISLIEKAENELQDAETSMWDAEREVNSAAAALSIAKSNHSTSVHRFNEAQNQVDILNLALEAAPA
jgi:hypothetical protein